MAVSKTSELINGGMYTHTHIDLKLTWRHWIEKTVGPFKSGKKNVFKARQRLYIVYVQKGK